MKRTDLGCLVVLVLSGMVATAWAASPPARIDFAVAYDSATDQTIMVGGYDSVFSQLEDTWLWNGQRWQLATTASPPGPRAHHCGAFDTVTSTMVIFGDVDSSPGRTDLRTWDGSNWSAMTGDPAMPADDGEMVFDSLRNRLILVIADAGADEMQTWQNDGLGWSRIVTATSPGALLDAGLAYDSARDVVVLYGGFDSGFAYSDATWEFDGTNWSQPSLPSSPPGLAGMAIAYHASIAATCIFGGAGDAGLYDQTWCHDGAGWEQVVTTMAPSPRWVTFMSYDPVRQTSVLFGGETCSGFDCTVLGDTWVFNGADWIAPLFADDFESGDTTPWSVTIP